MEILENEKPKILISEGDEDNRKFLKKFLGKFFLVVTCDSAESVYSHLQKDKFDLIILEIALRGRKNGLELAKELKSHKDYAHIPILCYTGYAYHQDRINALEAGCDMYLSKPTDIRILLDTLFKLLNKKDESFSNKELGNISFSEA
ncbi:MAG: response regulator [Melioribacteraceae bacterium]